MSQQLLGPDDATDAADRHADLPRAVAETRSGHPILARLRRLAASPALRSILSVAFFAAAVMIIIHEFGHLSWSEVLASVRATRIRAIAAAIGLTVASYACLAGVEWYALRWTDSPLSFPRASGVAVSAYAITNTVGFSAASGAAVRLRLYSHHGLNAVDIAKVTFLAGLAVSLCGPITAGLALALGPQTFSQAFGLAPMWVEALAVLLVSPAALWFIGFRPGGPRLLGGRIRHALGYPERLAAVAVGVGDWVLSGAALYVLLPHPSLTGFLPFLAVFVLGSLVSAASGVPGGVGVFEAVVLGVSRLSDQMHETAAALLLYRLIYCLGPACLVVGSLAVRQSLNLARRRGSSPR